MTRPFRRTAIVLTAMLVVTGVRAAHPQDDADGFFDALDHPAIGYQSIAPTDRVAQLAGKLAVGTATLAWDETTGYLPALLRALDVPAASQLAVFSKTSLQQRLISPQNPRAIYFNDSIMVAWPRGGFIEIASHDPRQGVVFYVVPQEPGQPQAAIVRRTDCLKCHHSYSTLGVPGLLDRGVVTGPLGEPMPFLGNYLTDDRSPIEERWAGWYVTGSSGSARHLGNQTPPATRDVDVEVRPQASSVAALRDALRGYLVPTSDVVAHLVFDHETRVINLITRAGWEARIADAEQQRVSATLQRAARELVDALLFVDEAPLPTGISGNPEFTAAFEARGPTDAKGRSLRALDLHSRLMRYPCSFMIYSQAFDALPPAALDIVYRGLWSVLSGDDSDANHRRDARLTAADRQAIVEILRDTKKGLPDYFRQPTR